VQNGAPIPGDDASAWLKRHFADDPAPEVSIRWDVNEEHDEGGYGRLLQILFSPRPDRPAA